MNSAANIATEGNDPAAAANRLGALIDKMIAACPDAVILVAKILNVGVCGAADAGQRTRLIKFAVAAAETALS
jgi:ABC-type branched-subunit amino acid transport system substrate-binding protein